LCEEWNASIPGLTNKPAAISARIYHKQKNYNEVLHASGIGPHKVEKSSMRRGNGRGGKPTDQPDIDIKYKTVFEKNQMFVRVNGDQVGKSERRS